MSDFLHFFSDYSLRVVALGSGLVGFISGALGCFTLLRRQSLLGDAISHAALPGICLAFLLTQAKQPLILLIGAAAAGWLATMVAVSTVRTTRIKEETSLAIVLSVFFGFGLLLLTYIQKLPLASQAGLDRYLFGQASTLLLSDLAVMAPLGALLLAGTAIFWKELKISSFDPGFASSLGFPVRLLDVLLMTLVVLAIVIGLQTVGVVLMSAMLVAPAAAARQWTDRLSTMVLLASAFGALSGMSGAVISSLTEGLPTGPAIVLCITALAVVSGVLAPARGLVWSWARKSRHRRDLPAEAIIAELQALTREHSAEHAHSADVLYALHGNRKRVDQVLRSLEREGAVRREDNNRWVLVAGANPKTKGRKQ